MTGLLRAPISDVQRLPSVDALYSELAELADELALRVVHLGEGADGLPVLAFGVGDADAQRSALLIGGARGDDVETPLLTLRALVAGPPAGWRLWAIPALSCGRLRLNDGALGVQDLAEAVRVRRGPAAAGEDPEECLPVHADGALMPDGGSGREDVVAPSPEALALARAIRHLPPDLVLSVRGQLAGSAAFAFGLEPTEQRQRALAAMTTALPMQDAAKVRAGRALAGLPGSVELATLVEEMTRHRKDAVDDVLSPATTAQWLALERPGALYCAVELPAFTDDALSDGETVTELTRTVAVRVEQRERAGKMMRTRVVTLAEGDDAGLELRAEPLKATDDAEEFSERTEIAAAGWLAVEAMTARRAALQAAYDTLRLAAPACRTKDIERGLMLLRDTDAIDRQMKSFQSNKRYGRAATHADVAWWTRIYPTETALVINEAGHSLDREDGRNSVIVDTLTALQSLADAQLPQAPLRRVALEDSATLIEGVLAELQASVEDGEPARLAAQATLAIREKQAADARRAARAAKHLRKPPAERRVAEERADACEAAAEEARAQLQALLPPTEVDVPAGEQRDVDAAELAERPPADDESTGEDAEPAAADDLTSELPGTPAGDGDQTADEQLQESVDELVGAPDRVESRVEGSGVDGSNGDVPLPPVSELIAEPQEEPIADEQLLTDVPPADVEPAGSDQPEAAVEHVDSPASPSSNDDVAAEEPDRSEKEQPADDALVTVRVAEPPTVDTPPGKSPEPVDLEQLLPPVLTLAPEWGRGQLDYVKLLPVKRNRPPLKALLDRVLAGDDVAPVRAEPVVRVERVSRPKEHVDVAEAPPVQAARSASPWMRRRSEVTPRPLGAVARKTPTPGPTGGVFLRRRRTL